MSWMTQARVDARDLLTADGMAVRVVSMPCREWFAAQPSAYRDRVLPRTPEALAGDRPA
jgi:transketolase